MKGGFFNSKEFKELAQEILRRRREAERIHKLRKLREVSKN